MDFAISDFHVGHQNILKLASRPFKSLDEMHRELISRWNSVVGPRDRVFFVGDYSFGSKEFATAFLKKLNGEKILIKGNHDGSDTRMKEIGFKEIHERLILEIGGEKVLFCHYPYAPEVMPTEYKLKYMNLRPKYEGMFLVHGHVHDKWKFANPKMINVSCEALDYTPISFDEIAKIIKDNPKGFSDGIVDPSKI
jgi:calcineurin-like phosphoesterase family protein